MRVRYIQALPVAVNKGLEQWLVVRDGLQDVPIVGHVADGPLAQPRTAQSEDVAGYTHTNTISHILILIHTATRSQTQTNSSSDLFYHAEVGFVAKKEK